MKTIVYKTDSSLSPRDFNVRSNGTIGKFGKHEVEFAAGMLISFFQDRGDFGTFTLTELRKFYNENGEAPDEALFGLDGAWLDDGGIGNIALPKEIYIIHYPNGELAITEAFLKACID